MQALEIIGRFLSIHSFTEPSFPALALFLTLFPFTATVFCFCSRQRAVGLEAALVAVDVKCLLRDACNGRTVPGN